MTLLQKNNTFEGVNLDNPLQKANQSMNDSVSGLKDQLLDPLKSASDSVQSGVALVKEEQSQIMGNVSKFLSQTIKGIDEGLKSITGGLLNMSNLGDVVKYEDGFKVNTDGLLRIAGQGLGFNINSMQDLKQQIGDGFLNQLSEMTDGLSNGLFYADGTRLGINDDWELTMGNQLIDFLGRAGGEDFQNVVNMAGVNAVLNTMLYETVKNGIYDGYPTFEGSYLFESDYHDALIDSLQYAIGNGDVKSLQVILDIIQEDGANKVRAKYPNLIEEMLMNFAFGENTTPEEYPQIKTMMLDVFVRVYGPDWYKYPTQFGMVTNCALSSYISDDAKLVLSEERDLIPLLASSGVFQDTPARDVFLGNFPNAIDYK